MFNDKLFMFKVRIFTYYKASGANAKEFGTSTYERAHLGIGMGRWSASESPFSGKIKTNSKKITSLR